MLGSVGRITHYAKTLKNSENKDKIIRNKNLDDPVTVADLKVNEIIIKKSQRKI